MEKRDLTIEEAVHGWWSKNIQTRVVNLCKEAGVGTIGDLIERTEVDIARRRGAGRKTIALLRTVLDGLGLAFKEL